MKVGKEHRIPLGKRALDILAKLTAARAGAAFAFPGPHPGKPQSNMQQMMMLLRRTRQGERVGRYTGFHSAFRDWAGDETPFAREIAEAALARVQNRAYRRWQRALKSAER